MHDRDLWKRRGQTVCIALPLLLDKPNKSWPFNLQIEEGEVDTSRSLQFASCFRRLFKREQDELMRQQREERQAKQRAATAADS
jgi:hypothetical protein